MNRAFLRVASVLAPLAVSAAAVAQSTGPRPPKLDTVANPIIGYAIMAVLSFIVLAISLYPSKRAHNDL